MKMLLKKKSLTLSLTTMVKSFLFHFQLSNIFENILFLKCSYSDKCKKRCIFSLKHFPLSTSSTLSLCSQGTINFFGVTGSTWSRLRPDANIM